MSLRFTEVDDLIRHQHSRLRPTDRCWFLREYIAHGGYGAGDTNNWISNLKKPVDRRGLPEWHYKEEAIELFSCEIAAAMPPPRDGWIVVPMPPHCAPDDPGFDDRMEQIAERVSRRTGWPWRPLIVTTQTREALHATKALRVPAQLASTMQVDEAQALPEPMVVVVMDDLLTSGCQFVAASITLAARFPRVNTIGVFVARRSLPRGEPDDDA